MVEMHLLFSQKSKGMQIASSRIWTHVAESISDDDNGNAKRTPSIYCKYPKTCLPD